MPNEFIGNELLRTHKNYQPFSAKVPSEMIKAWRISQVRVWSIIHGFCQELRPHHRNEELPSHQSSKFWSETERQSKRDVSFLIWASHDAIVHHAIESSGGVR